MSKICLADKNAALTLNTNDSLVRWPVTLAGLVCAAAYALLAHASQQASGAGLFFMLLCCLVTGSLTLGIFLGSTRGAIKLSCTDVLLFAVLFRLIGLAAYPILEDDHFRFLWDGWMTVTQGTPYGSVPSDWFDSSAVPERFE